MIRETERDRQNEDRLVDVFARHMGCKAGERLERLSHVDRYLWFKRQGEWQMVAGVEAKVRTKSVYSGWIPLDYYKYESMKAVAMARGMPVFFVVSYPGGHVYYIDVRRIVPQRIEFAGRKDRGKDEAQKILLLSEQAFEHFVSEGAA